MQGEDLGQLLSRIRGPLPTLAAGSMPPAESYLQANEREAAEAALRRAQALAGAVASERLEVRIRHVTAAINPTVEDSTR